MTVLRMAVVGVLLATVAAGLADVFRVTMPAVSAMMVGLCVLHAILAIRGFYLYVRGDRSIL